MSNDTQKADQIAFHFYTKLFYVVNQARATSEPRTQPKVDKWFNLETPDSDLFGREAREPYRNISVVTPPPLEVQVVLAIPELANNQVLVYLTPESSRARIEPTPRFIVLESWTLSFVPRRGTEDDSIDVALPTIYKHGIPLFRSLYSLLRVLPTWKLYKRLKRRTHHLSIHLRVRSSHDPDHVTLNFDTPASPSLSTPLATQTHTFSPVPHPLGTLTLSVRYLEDPNFQLEALESVLSSRFISQDLGGGTGFTPTLTKNQQRDSSIISSMSRSPPRRVVSSDESATIAERFILPAPTRTPSIGTNPVRIIPQQPPRQLASGEFAGIPNQSPSGLAISRLRKESQGSLSSPSSSFSGATIPFVATNPALSSLSSSPSSGTGPIRRPSINPVHPFKSNTVSVPTSSSPSLSIRQTGSPHSRSASLSGARHPPSPIGVGFNRPSPPNPSVEAGRRPGTSGSAGSGGSVGDHERRVAESSDDPARAGVPPRKRYSSSFGHRYAGSVGSAGGGSAEGGGGSVSGRSTPAIPPSVSGLGIEVPRERKESTSAGMASFGSTTTDDDDISIFVQDIDSRKPLSGRAKEREKREWEQQQDALRETHRQQEGRAVSGGQGHDREDSEASTVKPGSGYSHRGGLTTSSPPSAPSSRFSTLTRTGGTPTAGPSATSSGFSASRDRSVAVAVAQAQVSAPTSTSPPALSLSPTRGPMLTSQVEVEERLRRMNETFLKSLEGFGAGSNAAKRKEKELRKKEKEKEKEKAFSGKTSSETTGSGGEGGANGGGGGGGGDARLGTSADGDGDTEEDRRPPPGNPSRAVSIRSPREHALVDRGWGASGANTTGATMGFTSLGMGLRRAAEEEQGESIGSLGQSEVNASQGSEEVIGKMELYEERSRSRGYRRY